MVTCLTKLVSMVNIIEHVAYVCKRFSTAVFYRSADQFTHTALGSTAHLTAIIVMVTGEYLFEFVFYYVFITF